MNLRKPQGSYPIRKKISMNKSYRAFSIIQKVNLTKTINSLVWTTRKLPIIGKRLGDKYNFFEFKEVVYAFYPILSLLGKAIKSVFSLLVPLVLDLMVFSILINIDPIVSLIGYKPGSMMELNNYLAGRMIVPIFYLSLALFRNFITDNFATINDYYNIFHMEPKDLFKSFLYYNPAFRFVGRSLVFAFYFKVFGDVPIYVSILMSAAIFCLELGSSVFWLRIYMRDKKTIFQNGFLQLALMTLINFALALGVLWIGLSPLSRSLIAFALGFISLIAGLAYIKNFTSYAYVIEKANREYQISLDKLDTTNDLTTKIDVKDVGYEKVKGTGFAYLNNLFFIRHKKLITKPIIIRSLIVLALGFLLFFILKFVAKPLDQEDSDSLVYFLPMVMYILCKQNNIIKTMYLNCDQGLIPYGFYRENKNLLAMFKQRLISLLKIMVVPTLSLIISFSLVTSEVTGIRIGEIIGGAISIVFMGLFFTCLPLMQYYIFQPFDQEGKPVGKISATIDIILYWVCIFLSPQLFDFVGFYVFISIVIIFSINFVALTLFLVYKIGHKTFRIRS